MYSRKWTIKKEETKEIKIEDINNLSDEEFEKFMEKEFQKIEEITIKTNKSIKKIDFLLGNTPYRELSDETIKEEIVEGSSIFMFLIWLTIIEIFVSILFIAINLNIENSDTFIELSVIPGLIFFGFINFSINKIRHKKVLKFADENYLDSTLFKSEYIKIYKRFNFSRRSRNAYNYYIKFLDECEKQRKLEINETVYNKLNESINSKRIYVLKFPTYPFNKYKYSIFLAEKFENTSSIKFS